MKIIMILILSMIWSSAIQADNQVHPLTPETLWQIQRLGSPTLSPDGSRAVVAVTVYDVEKDKGISDLWLLSTDGGPAQQLTSGTESSSSPVWSPDGKYIAFLTKRAEDEQKQVYLLPMEGGEARKLADVPTGASTPKWLPDSSGVVFISRVWMDLDDWNAQGERMKKRAEAKMTAMVWDKPAIRWWDHWIDDREAHLFRVGLEGGEPEAITTKTGLKLSEQNLGSEGPGPEGYDISPDGKQIAFVADSDTTGVDVNFDVYLIPIAGGEAVNITTANTADDTTPLYSPDGRWLLYHRQEIKGFYGDKQRLYRYDRRSGERVDLTKDWDRSVSGLVWSPDSKRIYGAINDAGLTRVHEINPTSGKVRPITGDRSFKSLAVAGRGPVMVGLRESFVEPPTLVRINPGRGSVKKLSTFNDEVLAGVDFGTYESVVYKGGNGDDVQMWINYPPGFDKSKEWPLYLLIHGGPHNGVGDSFHFRWNAQLFSAPGYVTAWHNFHGSSGFGQSFTDSINPRQDDLPYQDTILAAEYMASQSWIDEDRMAAGGGSFGGYMASIILGRDHPFKTLIAHAAVYNRLTQYGADYGSGKRRFGEHWENPELIEQVSPHTGAGQFNTPTLVIHGEKDYRVPLNHGIELFQTLQNRGVRSRLIYFPQANHWVLKPQDSIFWYHAKEEWLDEFIGKGPTR
jgi:dipeptidyl aminopeptidase/acylaminoacyl peptidase